jgi:hypothetical protein
MKNHDPPAHPSGNEKPHPNPLKIPKKTSPNNLPSPLPNPNVEIGNFLDGPPILSQSEAHRRCQPLLTPSFSKTAHS